MSEKPDYRSTVFLPKTDFPMKAGLAQKEPAILARWAETRLYEQLRNARCERNAEQPRRERRCDISAGGEGIICRERTASAE